jgi:hypothetical protein
MAIDTFNPVVDFLNARQTSDETAYPPPFKTALGKCACL